MNVFDDFNTILENTHFSNWAPDWNVVKEIYLVIPDSYSVLTPFAYSYLEELIRSTTSEYGKDFFNKEGKKNDFITGMKLISLAIKENSDKPEYLALLEKTKIHFMYKKDNPSEENGRNKVAHGHLPPRFWGKNEFEQLIHVIAELSPYADF